MTPTRKITKAGSRQDTQVGFRMPQELREKLQSLADTDGRSFSNYMIWVLSAHVAIRAQSAEAVSNNASPTKAQSGQ